MTPSLDSPLVRSPSDRALRRRALVGTIAALPAIYFVGASVLKYNLGFESAYDPIEALTATADRQRVFNAVTPFVFIGGLATAWALNFSPLARLRTRFTRGAVNGQFQVRARPANLFVAFVAGGTMALLLGYLLLENLHHLRHGTP